ncbi:MAG TPA: Holliday junction resolvase RuvX [Terriglobales bacterium]|nr:Holliday junction resolvase RuvX [Terriglobales bacterium]
MSSAAWLHWSPFQHRNPFFGFFAGTYNSEVTSVPTQSANSRRPRSLGRVLGLDVGSKRIGVAISDLLGITAQGLETIQRKNKRLDFDQLGKVIHDYEVTEIVVGYPLRMSGAEGIQAEKIKRFAEEVRQRFPVPVHLWDERLSSAQANRLLRETEMSIKRRGQVVDQMAAVLILQSWMDARISR